MLCPFQTQVREIRICAVMIKQSGAIYLYVSYVAIHLSEYLYMYRVKVHYLSKFAADQVSCDVQLNIIVCVLTS